MWLCESKHILRDLSPPVFVLSILFGQCHGITYMQYAAIIRCEDKVYTFLPVPDIRELAVQFCQIAACSLNVFLRIEDITHRQSKILCRLRHNLHQPTGTGPRACLRVECRLLIALCCHQAPVPPGQGSILLEISVVMTYYSASPVEHRRIHPTGNSLL